MLVWLLLMALTGCKSAPTPTAANDAMAWVAIKGKEPLEIARTVSEVFKNAGYEAIPLPKNKDFKLKFEKPAGAGTSVLYSDWSFKQLWWRALVEIKQDKEDTCVVTCNAFRVNERGDPHFEEQKKVTKVGSGPYKDLLNEVKKRLNPEAKS